MRCLSCKYDLSNLTEHRCPECGREFDPNDLALHGLLPTQLLKRTAIRLVAVLVISYLLAFAFEFYRLMALPAPPVINNTPAGMTVTYSKPPITTIGRIAAGNAISYWPLLAMAVYLLFLVISFLKRGIVQSVKADS